MGSINKDIIYSKLSEKSPKDLLLAGWFNTKLSQEETDNHYNLKIFGHDLSACNHKNDMILYTTGSFAPIHDGHIFSWISAIKKAKELGFNIPLFIISPSHDDYVMKKSRSHIGHNIFNRLNEIEKKLKDFFVIHNYLKEYKSVFKVDLFESLFSSCPINFSEVLYYIKKNTEHIKNLKIGYVFGSDNYEFYKPFENEKYFYVFCINRGEKKIQLKNLSNIFFLDSISEFAKKESSTEHRKKQSNQSYPLIHNEKEGSYFIRNDIDFAIKHWIDKYPNKKDRIINAYKKFYLKLFEILKNEFANSNIEVVESSLEKQLRCLANINSKNILNLDICSNKIRDINQTAINFSRVFNIGYEQKQSKELIKREGVKNHTILNKKYLFVDDDIASGFTFNEIKKIVNSEGGEIDEILSLTEEEFKLENKNKNFICYDVIDSRDFLLGSNYSGLVCRFKEKIIRVPYWYPWVNLRSRAKVNNGKIVQEKIMSANLEFFKDCPFIKIEDLSVNLDDLYHIKFKSVVEAVQFTKEWQKTHLYDGI